MKEFAVGLVLRAGNILMRDFRKLQPEQIRFKKKRELVTKSDLDVDKFMVRKIKEAFPDYSILSEEEGFRKKKNSDYMWVIDPLDGTTNYIMRHTYFCITLALLKKGEPILGLIYAPYTRELFVAEKGKGAYRNEERMHVSNEGNLRDSFLTFAYSHDKSSLRRAVAAYQQFEFEARSMRHFGSSALELAFVAAGRVEAQIITPPVRIWDVAAGVLMVKEAGGKVTDFHGDPRRIAYNGLVASNKKVHSKILQIIKAKKI
ncbi:MAG: inositol monophosphatase family protein [Patescibacteria group bacterium]